MINTIQLYQLNNSVVSIDVAQIPLCSPDLRKIFEECNIELPRMPERAELSSRVQSLVDTKQMLESAKHHSVRNKIIAVLKMALIVAGVAGTVLGFVFAGPLFPVFVIPLVFLGGLYTAFVYNDMHKIVEIEKRDPTTLSASHPPGWIVASAFSSQHRRNGWHRFVDNVLIAKFSFPWYAYAYFPLHAAITREARIEKVLARQRADLKETLAATYNKNQQTFPIAHQFFTENSDRLFFTLEDRIGRCQEALATMEGFAERASHGEAQLHERISRYRFAVTELNRFHEFYSGLS